MGRGALLLAGGPLTEILVGTDDGLRRLTDGAVLLDGRITSLTSNPAELWALVGGRSLWRIENGRLHEVARISDLPGRCILPTDDGTLIGTAEAHLVRARLGRPERVQGFDDAPGRDEWYTPWGGPPDTRSLAAGADGAVYANVHVGGILRSEDGDAWTPTIDIEADVHQVVAHPDRAGTVLAACAWGLAVSRDHGATWSIDADGLHGSYARAVAVAGDTVLVTASTGPFTDRAAVYRRPLENQEAFERCSEGLPEWFGSNIDTHCLAASGDAAAFGTSDGAVFVSGDRGGTWERAASDLPPVRALTIALASKG